MMVADRDYALYKLKSEYFGLKLQVITIFVRHLGVILFLFVRHLQRN